MKQKKNRRLSKFIDLVISLARLDVPVYAANAAYFIILSAFPMVMLLLNILSYTTLSGGALLEILEQVIPEALMPPVSRLLNGMFASSSTTLVSVSALATLWASSRGVYGILVGLNRIYGVQEDRGYIFTRLLSLVYTFLFLLVLLLTLALHVFGQTILAQIPHTDSRAIQFVMEIISSRFLVLLVIQTAVFTAMFMFLPNRRNKLLTSLPGALLASLGWLLFSDVFSIYVSHFGNYSTIYGSLSAVAIAMLWLYTCMAIVFYGGALNKYLMDVGYQLRLRRQKKQKAEENKD
ncbi:MAG: YihY/virulence factor BrkB family protein [Candidatus Faecousia sp.]|nr:YihY/virulence factor BrkB family protein [Clostridiales bacterium]MDD7650971.1 YihY/virulence factor BrkB family protein [Bacillota bacterium]MDY4220495.1 YihY/virulence factor BrkB family protein [Candidatus Faecousia sp.]